MTAMKKTTIETLTREDALHLIGKLSLIHI